MLDGSGLGNRAHAGVGQYPGKRDLRGADPIQDGDCSQYRMLQQAACRVATGHRRHSMCDAQRQEVRLDAAPGQVVEHLFACTLSPSGSFSSSSRSARSKLLTPQERIFPASRSSSNAASVSSSGMPPPVQQVEVEAVGAQPAQARLQAAIVARRVACDGSTLLTRKTHPAVRRRLADEFLGRAVAVHLGGIDQRHPQLDPELQRLDLVLGTRMVPLRQVPGALPEDGNRLARRELNSAQREYGHERHGRPLRARNDPRERGRAPVPAAVLTYN